MEKESEIGHCGEKGGGGSFPSDIRPHREQAFAIYGLIAQGL
jgi:hypothetical protein